MAEEEKKKKPEEGGEAEAPRKSKLPLIIGLVVALLVLGGGGAFAYFKFVKADETEASAEGAAAEAKEKEEAGHTMKALDTFVVNLSDKTGRRYLKTTLTLELSGEKIDDELSKKMPKVRDAIIVLLSSKTLDDVSNTQGKFQIRKEVRHRLNKILTGAEVHNVFYTEFVIQ